MNSDLGKKRKNGNDNPNNGKRFCSTPQFSNPNTKSPQNSVARNPKDISIENKREVQRHRVDKRNGNLKPSTFTPSTSSLDELAPRGLNVFEYAESRVLEIKNLKSALQDAQDFQGGLAFQKLPRHMRRRASSHDVRRLPRHIRSKALNQIAAKKKPTSRKHKRKPRDLLAEFTRRSRNHCWLETHIWHAKRFKMISKWGYKLAKEPCDKSFRATYRSTQKTCLIQDKSYTEVIEIIGVQEELIKTLNQLIPPYSLNFFGENNFVNHSCHGNIILYHENSYPRQPIGPVTFHWASSEDTRKKLVLLCHPGITDELLDALKSILRVLVVESVQCATDEKEESSECDVVIKAGPTGDAEDKKIFDNPGNNSTEICRNESAKISSEVLADEKQNLNGLTYVLRHHKLNFVMFSLAGPESFNILRRVLTFPDENRMMVDNWNMSDNFIWENCKESQICNLPKSIFNLYVEDPRFHIPYKKQNPLTIKDCNKKETVDRVANTLGAGAEVHASCLWIDSFRNSASESKLSDHEINQMRSQLLLPGSKLPESSAIIPIVVLKHIHPKKRFRKKPTTSLAISYDVVLPKNWAMPFLVAFNYQGARVGGLREDENLCFEKLSLHFPTNFPDSLISQKSEEEEAKELEDYFNRRPPSKRRPYDVLGINNPFKLPWLDIVKEWHFNCNILLPRFYHLHSMACDMKTSFYVLRDKEILKLLNEFVQKQFFPDGSKQEELNMLMSSLHLYCHSLIPIRLFASHRGCPQPKAQLHIPSTSDFLNLKQNQDPLNDRYYGPCEPAHKGLKQNFLFVCKEHKILRHNALHIGSNTRWLLGYVQSGRYSLAYGSGHGLGFISLIGLFYLLQENDKFQLLYRNIDSSQFRFCDFEIIVL